MKASVLTALLLFTVGISTQCMAEGSYSQQAVQESSKACSHAGTGASYGLAASGQAVSAVAAVPFAVAGSIGAVSGHIADGLMHGASAPLPLTDESITAGPPPDVALRGKNGKY